MLTFLNYYRFSRLLLLIGVVALCIWGWVILHKPSTFPLKTIQIYGTFEHVDKQALQMAIVPYVNTGFFTLDAKSLTQALLKLPWVGDVSLRRVWPNVLIVNVAEKEIIARWGTEGLLTENGNLFTPPQNIIFNNVPLLAGPEGEQVNVLRHYQQMSIALKPLGLSITQLMLSDHWSWSMTLDNGMTVLLGRGDVMSPLERLVEAYPKVFGDRGAEVETVDLRYNNGLAVKWRH